MEISRMTAKAQTTQTFSIKCSQMSYTHTHTHTEAGISRCQFAIANNGQSLDRVKYTCLESSARIIR